MVNMPDRPRLVSEDSKVSERIGHPGNLLNLETRPDIQTVKCCCPPGGQPEFLGSYVMNFVLTTRSVQ